jgi:hypothetical protein
MPASRTRLPNGPEPPIPGTSERAILSIVTIEFTANGQKSTKTFYAVDVGGPWRWVLADVSGWANAG